MPTDTSTSLRLSPSRLPRDEVPDRDGWEQRLRVVETCGPGLDYLAGRKRIEDPGVFEGNIENFIGLAQVPVGLIGPLRIQGAHARGDFYVPMATTEGALVASYNRGAKIVSASGGARVICLIDRVCRAPAFVFHDLREATTFVAWIADQHEALGDIARSGSHYSRLEDVKATVVGNQVFLECEFTTGDAAGQNMVTIATDAMCRHIAATSPVRPRHWFIESNLSGDKKATARAFGAARGKRVTAEVVVPRGVVRERCRTSPEMVVEFARVATVGAVQSGAIGVQGHYANALAAIFIACGQDAACVAEAAVGITRFELAEDGALYASVTLPNLIVGTVGGGTGLPTQGECLAITGCNGTGMVKKFAEVCAATVLAGEISISAALAAGQFTQAHVRYGRKQKRDGRERP